MSAEEKDNGASTADGLPRTDFTTFVLSMAQSAHFHLGLLPDPVTARAETDLPMARQTIDLLALLAEKTKGNLTGEEERILEQILFDLRLRFVEVSQRGRPR